MQSATDLLMIHKMSSGKRKCLDLTSVFLTLVYLNTCCINCTSTPATPGGIGCPGESVTSIDTRDPCSRQYLRCETGFWRRAMCVAGIISNDTGKCVPYSQDCPDPGVTVRTFTRDKRQASTTDNCLRSYMCPTDLTSIFIYPDWVNEQCDSYIVCAAGRLVGSSCLRDGYSYYNPQRLSCEESASPTNICIHRRNTVFA